MSVLCGSVFVLLQSLLLSPSPCLEYSPPPARGWELHVFGQDQQDGRRIVESCNACRGALAQGTTAREVCMRAFSSQWAEPEPQQSRSCLHLCSMECRLQVVDWLSLTCATIFRQSLLSAYIPTYIHTTHVHEQQVPDPRAVASQCFVWCSCCRGRAVRSSPVPRQRSCGRADLAPHLIRPPTTQIRPGGG